MISRLLFMAGAALVGCGGGQGSPGPDGGAGCRSDGACPIFVAPAGQSAQNPCYSPDGARLLFTLFRGGYNVGPAALLTVAVSGGVVTTVIDDGSTNVDLPGTSWNAATNRLTFTSDKFGAEEIMTVAPDGTAAVRVTTHTGANYFEPSFSPDGMNIVFEVNRSPSSAEIWKVRADGSAPPLQLTSGSLDRQPNWSPRGDRILFQRQAIGDIWRIYTVGIDGAGIMAVTPAADSCTDGAWSPDGNRIVYSASQGDEAGASLYVIPATGGTPSRVTSAAGYDGAVTWSPDGAWLAFESSSDPSGDTPTGLGRIVTPR